jgi:uncharacterized heparinase superfamily protein
VPYLPPPAHAGWDGGRSVRLLNREVCFGAGIEWSHAAEGPLWAYQLHQFDWVRGASDPEARLRVLLDWVERHRSGIGWDPGPTSLRIFAWLKLLTTPGALPERPGAERALLASLADQVATVEAHLERHLLANHYLWNLLAIALGGVALEGSRAGAWRAHEPRLCAELEEQIGGDGAHYERSPMYHSLLLENLLDLLNALRAAPGALSAGTTALLEEKAAGMLGALDVWTHPDGQIALFGDSAFEIAQPPAVLHRYAASLGIGARGPARPGLLEAAGFVRLEGGPFTLIATAAPPTPAYQPGHAHRDARSLELSVHGQRFVTDTGVCEYIPGRLRDLSRATRSHATVEVDGQEQAEVWAAHRIGGRPDVGLIRADPPGSAEAVCAGWATPEVLHRRRFEVDASGVVISDRFDAPAPCARLQLPLAPGLEPVVEGCVARVPIGRGQAVSVDLPAEARWRVERGPFFPQFGRQLDRAVLVGEAECLGQATWRLGLS